MIESSGSRYEKEERPSRLCLTLSPKPVDRYEVWLGDGSDYRLGTMIGQGHDSKIEEKILPVIRGDLQKVCNRLRGEPDKKIRWHRKQVGVALEELYQIGQTALLDLLGGSGLATLRALVDSQRTQELARAEETGQKPRPLRFELRTPWNWPIPLDILPLSRRPQTGSPIEEDEIREFAPIFAAFSGVTRHVITDDFNLPVDKRILTSPVVSLLFLHHAGAASADTALESLKVLSSDYPLGLDVDGPLPNNLTNSSSKLAQLLIEQGMPPPGSQGGTQHRIVHIHAHAETGEPSLAWAHRLRFAYQTHRIFHMLPREVVVSNGLLADKHKENIPKAESGPFIFVNACGGAGLSYSGGHGLDDIFLISGYRAVIGPVVSMPGRVAQDVAQRFYERLLEGKDLAEALFCARRDLLSDSLNPLGAFYTIHGESELRLDRPYKKEVKRCS